MNRLIVLMGTVPWRLRSCERTLQSLANQRRVPDQVILHLDGYRAGMPMPARPERLNVELKSYPRAKGVGNWWRSLTTEHASAMIACVGDDLTYGPTYFEHAMATQQRLGGCVCWHGRDRHNQFLGFRASPSRPVSIVRAGTACVIVPGSALLGMSNHPLAPLFFAPNGHDEAFFSWWLSHRRVSITRAAGRPDLIHHPEGSDSRATSIRYAARKVALRRLLGVLFGWPGGSDRPSADEWANVCKDAQRLGFAVKQSSRRRIGLPHAMLSRSTLARSRS